MQEAIAPDKNNGNTLWDDATAKGMSSVQVGFYIRGKGDTQPTGYKFIKFHMIFDVKMEDLRCKTRVVAGGHMIDMTLIIKYASVN